jgi:hypothetical protein
MTIANNLKTLSKSPNELIVGNYMVLFGGKDLMGEFFTKSTVFDSNYTDIGTLYVDFEHGLDPDGLGIDDSSVLGVVDWKSARVDEKGIFVQRVLNRRAKYVDFLSELLDAGVVGNSSEAIRGKTAKNTDGEITAWPLKRDTLTLTPMEPRMIAGNVLEAAKSLATMFPHSRALATFTGAKVDDLSQGIKTIEALTNLRDAEKFLRDSGVSRTVAVAFMSRVKSLGQSDSDGGELRSVFEALKRRGEVLTA